MAKVVFLMGRPGSGKSTAARYIETIAKDKKWSSCHINDYTFLLEMFRADVMKPEKEKQFASTKLGGFDVVDFSVLDDVFHRVEQEALTKLVKENEVVLLEFARGDYHQAFMQFNKQFLRNAYFLFFEADVEVCVARVNKRASYPAYDDDHFISEKMLRSYYSTENKCYMEKQFPLEFGIDRSRIEVIDNMGTWEDFGKNIKSFLDTIWLKEEKPAASIIVIPSKVDAPPRITEPLTSPAVEKTGFVQQKEPVKIGVD